MTTARQRLATGGYGEASAAHYLVEQGMVVLDRNWRCSAGEIDLVLRDGSVLVFCEVKTRASAAFGAPLEAVTPAKLARLAPARRALDARARGVRRRRAARPGGCAAGPLGARPLRPRAGCRLMGWATARTVILTGMSGHVVDVQADVTQGMVSTTLVGRPDPSVSEARDRCRTAIVNSRLAWPSTRRVTILLSPGGPPQAGSPPRPRHRRGGAGAADGVVESRRPGRQGVPRRADPGRSTPGGARGPRDGDGGARPRAHRGDRAGRARRRRPGWCPGMSGRSASARWRRRWRCCATSPDVPDAPPVEPLSAGSLLSWRGDRRSGGAGPRRRPRHGRRALRPRGRRRRVATTCCSAGPRVPARRRWRSGCRACSRT